MPSHHEKLLAIRSNVENVAWPPLATSGAATLAMLVHHFEDSQWLPRHIIERQQLAQLSILVAHAYQFSTNFRQRMELAGLRPWLIQSMEEFRKLPILSRNDIQQAGASLHCSEMPKAHLPVTEGKSSGSTGEPVTVKKTGVTALFWQANMMREHFWHGRNLLGKLMVIRSGIKEPVTQKGWGAPADFLFETSVTMGLPVLLDIKEIIKHIQQFQPEHLNIYPSTLDGLITQCERDGITFEGIKHIWCISETVTPELRKRAETFFKARVEDDYSSNELGVLALQCPETGLYHEMSESVIIEILDEQGNPCKPGDIGKVLVTSINNFATPLIRYEIGDYAQAGETCRCGRGLPTIHSIKGRTRNLIVKPDGSRHWPTLTMAIFRAELPIHQFQVIQHSFDDVEVRLYTDRALTVEEEAILTEKLHIALGHAFPLRYVYFNERLPLAANGKFEDFICRVQAA